MWKGQESNLCLSCASFFHFSMFCCNFCPHAETSLAIPHLPLQVPAQKADQDRDRTEPGLPGRICLLGQWFPRMVLGCHSAELPGTTKLPGLHSRPPEAQSLGVRLRLCILNPSPHDSGTGQHWEPTAQAATTPSHPIADQAMANSCSRQTQPHPDSHQRCGMAH